MPVATAGLLSALEDAGYPANAWWEETDQALRLRLDTELTPDHIGELLADAEWPSPDRIPWPPGAAASGAQAIKPVLERQESPADAFRRMVADAPPVEARFLLSLLTDGALDNNGVPSRSRLLRGVKADLSGISNRPRTATDTQLSAELTSGPDFLKGSSGLGLGLVP
ncbi:MAG: hypothetical protein H0W36_14600, partial [Gemmatimonadetes bacterium]|nr:hypothetical protein [Gemmatimonadota bacterium]